MNRETKVKMILCELSRIDMELRENPILTIEDKKDLMLRRLRILQPDNIYTGSVVRLKKNKTSGVLYTYIPKTVGLKEDDICIIHKSKY